MFYRSAQLDGNMGRARSLLLRADLQPQASVGDLAVLDVHVRPHRRRALRLQHDHADHRRCLPCLMGSMLWKASKKWLC